MTLDPQLVEALTPATAILGAPLADAQYEQIAHYLQLLAAWSRQARLTAVTRPADAIRVHILDSLLCVEAGLPQGATLLDVGSGAGLPGIPLKIARPDLVVTLLEAASKKAAFLEMVAAELNLALDIVGARAEEAAHDPRLREQFDLVVARAVAPLPVLCELTLPFTRVGGKAVLLKGPGVTKELDPGRRAAAVLGGDRLRIRDVQLPGGPRRILVEIVKTQATPLDFPRRAGVPAKRPLGSRGPTAV